MDYPTTAVMNLKGGPGKTTVVNHLAHASAARTGEEVLIGDVDPQGNSTTHFTGHNRDNPPPAGTLADCLDRTVDKPIEDIIIPARTRDGIYIAPSGMDEMQAVQDSLLGKTGGELGLRRAIKEIRGKRRMFWDCRTALDLLTRSAMLASDNVIVVCEPEADSLNGLAMVVAALDEMAEFMQFSLPIAGVVINRIDRRRKDHEERTEDIRAYCEASDIPMLGTPIPQVADVSRLTNAGMGIDQHRKADERVRYQGENFNTILNGIDAAPRVGVS